jgi:hypothetical protein
LPYYPLFVVVKVLVLELGINTLVLDLELSKTDLEVGTTTFVLEIPTKFIVFFAEENNLVLVPLIAAILLVVLLSIFVRVMLEYFTTLLSHNSAIMSYALLELIIMPSSILGVLAAPCSNAVNHI